MLALAGVAKLNFDRFPSLTGFRGLLLVAPWTGFGRTRSSTENVGARVRRSAKDHAISQSSCARAAAERVRDAVRPCRATALSFPQQSIQLFGSREDRRWCAERSDPVTRCR